MNKSLEQKLERIRTGRYTPDDFVIADAKDADMGFGAAGPGAAGPGTLSGAPEQFKTKA